MYYLENENLRIGIHPKGAELQSIYDKEFGLDYLWGGDPAVWARHSPLLFPIVGALKKSSYYFEGNTYTLSRHGFARDMEFAMEAEAPDSFTFLLQSNEATRRIYPFDFKLRVSYLLAGRGLRTVYSVTNPSPEPLYFSIGGHPAFRVPLVPSTAYSDYYLEFNEEETLSRWPISDEGLIGDQPLPLLDHQRILPLDKGLFAKDALVFKYPLSAAISLRSAKTERGLRMDFPGFPFLGIWAAPGADFLCIEPWCGIADSIGSDQQLVKKEGIRKLGGRQVFERTWSLRFF
jgi:galactose mutarotase-like enzyme